MIKRTLIFENPTYLSARYDQLVVNYPDKDIESKSVAVEDIGVIVLEHQQITLTNALMIKLIENNVCIIHCDAKHMPSALTFPIEGHSEQSERFKNQIYASKPLKKNLWQQTVMAKIENQAALLETSSKEQIRLVHLAQEVKSGDPHNCEGQAAAIYWPKVFGDPPFIRHQDGVPPNNLLNYGYAILRAITARALVSSGMLPTLGIFHRNKYNAFCLADDIMEPYRPFVDLLVRDIMNEVNDYFELNKEIKQQLLKLPIMDVVIDGKNSPLMVAMSRTTNSLYECFKGDSRKILYPVLLI